MRLVRLASLVPMILAFLLGNTGCSKPPAKKDEAAVGANKTKPERTKEPTVQEKLLGRWVATKGAIPPGSTFDFAKDGKLTITMKIEGKEISDESSYKVEGETLRITHKEGPMDVTESLKIKTLNDLSLITEDQQGKAEEFKKK